VLATTVYATRCSVLRSLGTLPGNLVYHRDMFVDLPLVADLIQIQDCRQQLIDENLQQQNANRREYRYIVGKYVLIKSVDPTKMEPKARGPYVMHQVARNATVVERLNIRRLIPSWRN
jgi:hypothetical protein